MRHDGPDPFGQFDSSDIRALIAEYPLAWVLAPGSGEGSLLPLIATGRDDGSQLDLIGHMARSNPLHEALRRESRALILFQGPQAYVSPEQVRRRDWAPTWVYAQLKIEAMVEFEPQHTPAALDVLIGAMEAGRATPWASQELGSRYEGMLGAIIGFRARVIALTGRFKLGQDERPDDLNAILRSSSDPDLQRWIRRMNRHRLP